MSMKHSILLVIATLLLLAFSYWLRSRSTANSTWSFNSSTQSEGKPKSAKNSSSEIFQDEKIYHKGQGNTASSSQQTKTTAKFTYNHVTANHNSLLNEAEIPQQETIAPDTNSQVNESNANMGTMEASPLEVEYNFTNIKSKLKFLAENQIYDPAKVKLTRPELDSLELVSNKLKGQYSGLIQHPDNTVWQINFNVDGKLVDRHLEGNIQLNITDENMITIMQSQLRGSLENNFNFEATEDVASITILPNPENPSQVIQIFLEDKQDELLIGNLYLKNNNGKFLQAVPMVLEKLSGH